jgi:hypothetical protein
MPDAIKKIARFADISKIEDNDDGSVTVFGIASTEAVDAHGEVVSKAAMENALPDFMKYGTGALRSMHQPIAAGVVTKAEVNDDGQTVIEAKVVDENEVKKVKAGVYKGFSIGGNQVPGGYDKVTKTITAMSLTEISLVDRPANPEAVISVWKLEDAPAATVSADQADAATALADLLNKGDIDAARLVALAQAEIAKSTTAASDPAVVGAVTAESEVSKSAATAGTEPEATGAITAKGEGIGFAAPIQKGMYGVSRFADLLTSLGYLTSDAEWEKDWEQDDSPVPAQLREWLTQGAAIFAAMAAEEVAEFVAQFGTPEATSAAVVSLDIELGEKTGAIRKSLDDAAASGSLAGYLSITKAHMPENEVAAIVLADGYEKATTAVLARLAPGDDAIAKLADANATISKLQGERDELAAKVAKFESAPAPAKGVLRVVVEKGVDNAQLHPNASAEPEVIKKADGTVDQEATALAAVRKLHQSGGQPLRSFV